MADYDFTRLSARDFEHLVQSLAVPVFGANLSQFGDGPDGGREATFDGTRSFPSVTDAWTGYGAIQAKFRQRPDRTDSSWLLREVKEDLSRWTERDGRRPEYLLIATNVVLTPVNRTGGRDKLAMIIDQYARTLNLKGWAIWAYDEIRALLDNNADVRSAYAGWITSGDVLSSMLKAVRNEEVPAASRVPPVEPTLTIQLHADPATFTTSVDASFASNVNDWYLKALVAEDSDIPLIVSEIRMDPVDHGEVWDAEDGMYRRLDTDTHATEVLRMLVDRYKRPLDDVITEIALISIRNLRWLYPTTQDLEDCIGYVLTRALRPSRSSPPGYVLLRFSNSQIDSVEVTASLRAEYFENWAIEAGQNPRNLRRFIKKWVRNLVFMPDDDLRKLIWPAIVDRWLRKDTVDEVLAQSHRMNLEDALFEPIFWRVAVE